MVYHPRRMTAEKLQELLFYAWDAFYADEPQEFKMFKLLARAARREMADGTYRPRDRRLASRAFGEPVQRAR